jgi:HK97 gp10 family phage protein
MPKGPTLPPSSAVPVAPGWLLALNFVAIDALLNSEQGPAMKRLIKAGRNVERGAKRYCPVDTGRLRSSITSVVGEVDGETSVVVGTNVEYAPHIEFGTSRQTAQSFLRRALDDETRKLGAP